MKSLFKQLFGNNSNAGPATLPKPASSSVSELLRHYVTPQSTEEIIAEIHSAFYTAGDKLLAEAKAVIEGTDTSSFQKAEDLSSLGFRSAKGVPEAAAAKQAVTDKAKLQALLLEYSVKYPSYRFIDDAGIAAICTKYNLIFGNASQYTGFVPAKNLAEIKAFGGVKEEDFINQCRITYDGSPIGSWRDAEELFDYHYSRYESRSSKDYLICAPAKDMELEAGQEIKGHQIVKVHIPDPVVLLPVRGDLYIILTAWGDEASDPLVQKENLN